MGQITNNTGKVLAKRPPGKTTILALTFAASEVDEYRKIAEGITLRRGAAGNGKHPSMSLLARYAQALFIREYLRDPQRVTAELDRMVTPEPKPALKTKLLRSLEIPQ